MNLLDDIVAQAQQLTAIRRDIHAHPELCFQEHRTAQVVKDKLTEWGIPFEAGIGGTGVVGTLKCGQSSRAIGLRADMDALPMQERNTFEHASRKPGHMHACGHDGHVATLLAAAQHLAKHRNFDGTVHFIFQPAEEGGGGAREMIKDGLMTRFPMEQVFGLHNWPGMPTGHFAVSPGPVMASSNEFKITVRGKGSHAALPHESIDPVPVACQMVQAFQTIVSRNKKPVDAAVISVTMIHAGEATNVVPNACELQGTVRTFSIAVLDLIEERMRQVAHHVAAAHNATVDFQFVRNYPPTINHEAPSVFVRQVLQDMVGADHVHAQEPTMGAEDFSYMLLEKPGCYFFMANGMGDHRMPGHGEGPCTLHNPSYDFNDDLIPLGGTAWVRLVHAYFAKT